MQIDTAGTYTLKYTAEDECGNVTEVEREVEAVRISYRTVLYTDGTFIINEKSMDINANVALHGAATNVYAPYGSVSQGGNPYRWTQAKLRPWHNQQTSVTRVEIGSPVKPEWTSYWFNGFTNVSSYDFTNLDTSATTQMDGMFSSWDIDTLDLSDLDTSATTSMDFMFTYVRANQLIIPFDTHLVRRMVGMFRTLRMTTVDISSFDFSSVANIDQMFEAFNGPAMIETIFVAPGTDLSSLEASQVFRNQAHLVGGAGTVWDDDYESEATYARVDNPPSAPGYFTAKS